MTSNYIGILIDPSTDNYTVPASDFIGGKITRKVNGPSSFEFVLHNPAGALNNTYEMDDKVDVHVGVEPLFKWGSLSALKLDGVNDDVLVTKHASINFGVSDFSVAFRFKIDAFAGATYSILEKGDALDGEFWIIYMSADGSLSCLLYDLPNNATVVSAAGFDDGEWHSAVVTLDRSDNGQWYIDGSASGAAVNIAAVADIDNDDEDLYIGRRNGGDWYLNGKLDEIAIWSEVVSAGDISNYESGTVDAVNLELYLDFDEGYGSTATDESINTNNGAIRSGGAAATDRWVNPKIITGILEEIEISRDRYGVNVMTCRGQDYLTVLSYRLGRASFQGARTAGQILGDLYAEFASGEYSTTNINNTINGVTVTFSNFTVGTQKSILNIMRELAEMPLGGSFDFYLDGANDLHWHQRGSATWDSGITLDGDNIKRFNSRRSVKDRKTFVHVRGAQSPVEETTQTHNTVTNVVYFHNNHWADDFIAEHNNLMKLEAYLQKVGSPSDLTGRIVVAKNDAPGGDFVDFNIRAEDVPTTASWIQIPVGIDTQVGTRYFIKFDKQGTAANTYKWYGDTPAVLDTRNKALNSSNALMWSTADYDLSMKLYYGEYTEVTASNAQTPKREAVITLSRAVDASDAQRIAKRMLRNYYLAQWQADLETDAQSVELKPADLITLNETGSGLASKTYRIESITMDFGAQCKTETISLSISSVLPYESLDEVISRLMDREIGESGSQFQAGNKEAAEPARIGRAVVARSLVGYEP